MHVALFSPAWPLSRFPNGIVTYVHEMRDALVRRGHRVTVFAAQVAETTEGVRLLRGSFRYAVTRWWRLRTRRPYFPILDWGIACAADVLAVHRQHPIDVIEMEESFGWFHDVARLTAVPTVVKLHGPAFLSLPEPDAAVPFSQERIVREGRALRAASVITSPALRTLQETLVRYDCAPPIARHVVNPVSAPPSMPLWSAQACEPRTILFVGRFDARKGGDIALHAFGHLAAADPALRLVFVGPDAGVPGPDGDMVRFESFVNTHLPQHAGRVEYRGHLPPSEIAVLRSRAAVTLIPSRWENQSYTMLEAMLQGCPIVSSDAGGQGESIRDGDTGLLATAGDVDACARAIRALLDAPARAAELGRRARAHAQALHAPERVVDETLAVYDEAIALSRARGLQPAAA